MITVKTTYNGQVGFPEKFYKPGEQVLVGKKVMSLDGKKPTGWSEYMDDKWGRGKYRLVYFSWEPDVEEEKQIKLL